MKEIVIFDVDNTIVRGQSQFLFLKFLYKNNYVSSFYYIRIMFWFLFYKIGLVKNPLSVMKYAFLFVKRKNTNEIDFMVDDFFNNVLKGRIYPESVSIINEHLKLGKKVILISNAADVLIKKVAEYLGISEFLSTKLEVIDGKYTGNIFGDIMYGINKLDALEKYLVLNSLSLENSWGYTDHHSDIPLLLNVTHPFVVNPTKKLMRVAVIKNWNVLNFKL